MKAIIDDYGRVILLVIVISGCLTMFVNFWYGSDSMLAIAMNGVMRASTDGMTITSTHDDGGVYIKKENGSYEAESQQNSAIRQEEIAARKDPTLYGVGYQNSSSQLLIGTSYNTTDLFWAVDADGVEIHKSLTSDNGIDSNNYFNEEGYFRVLSVATASGYDIISNLSDLNAEYSIAYKDVSYSNKTGIAGTKSGVSGDTFNIYAEDGSPWLTYNVSTQKWYFYKSGTYCLDVFVCDSKGKSTTGTVYISVAKRLTDNNGDGTNTSPH